MVRARTGATAAPRRRRRPPTPGDDSSIAVAPPLTEELSDDAPAYSNGDRSGRQLDVADLVTFSQEQLIDFAPEVGLRSDGSLENLNRDALFHRVRQAAANRNQLTASGVLEVMDAGHGLLRSRQIAPVPRASS